MMEEEMQMVNPRYVSRDTRNRHHTRNTQQSKEYVQVSPQWDRPDMSFDFVKEECAASTPSFIQQHFVGEFGVLKLCEGVESRRLILQLWYNHEYMCGKFITISGTDYGEINIYEIEEEVPPEHYEAYECYIRRSKQALQQLEGQDSVQFSPFADTEPFDGVFFNVPIAIGDHIRSIFLLFDQKSAAEFIRDTERINLELQACIPQSPPLSSQSQFSVAQSLKQDSLSLSEKERHSDCSQIAAVLSSQECNGICMQGRKLIRIVFSISFSHCQLFADYKIDKQTQWTRKHLKNISLKRDMDPEAVELIKLRSSGRIEYQHTVCLVFRDSELLVYLKSDEFQTVELMIKELKEFSEEQQSLNERSEYSESVNRSTSVASPYSRRKRSESPPHNRDRTVGSQLQSPSLARTADRARSVSPPRRPDYLLSRTQTSRIDRTKHSEKDELRSESVIDETRKRHSLLKHSDEVSNTRWYSLMYLVDGEFKKTRAAIVGRKFELNVVNEKPELMTLLSLSKLSNTSKEVEMQTKQFINYEKKLQRDALENRSGEPFTEVVVTLLLEKMAVFALRTSDIFSFKEEMLAFLDGESERSQGKFEIPE